KAAARPRGRASDAFQLVQILVADVLDAVLTDPFVDVADRHVAAAEAAGHYRAAIHEHRRHIEPYHCHHHSARRLVAAGEADQRVVAMAAHRQLDGIGDDLAAGPR